MSLKLSTVSALLLCALFVGCGKDTAPLSSKSTKYEVADDSPSASTPQASPEVAAANSAAPNAGTVSDVGNSAPSASGQAPPKRPAPINQAPAVGSNPSDAVQPTPEQLLTVIRRLREQEPRGNNQEELIADFLNVQTQLIQAVDMLLGLKPGDDVVTEAADAKLQALAAVSQLGGEGALDQAFAFAEELEKHPSKKVSDFGRQQSFVTLLNAFSTNQTNDVQQVIDAYKKLAAEQPKEGGLLQFGRDVASRLIEKGNSKEAAELLRYTAGLVQPTDDKQLNAVADSLVEQAKFEDVSLRDKLNAVGERKEGAVEEFIKTLDELTSGETVGVTTLQTIMQIGSMLEADYGDAATKVYDVLEVASGKISDEELAAGIKETIEKFRLRSAIVGKPFTLEGLLVDGTSFDWSQYKGKVVLVDFWATWCGPCLREIPNIRANYEKYRDQGFEVVGVNIDEEVQEFKDFTALQPLPWPSVLSNDPAAIGWDHPMATKNGVAAIPFLVLVDRDGTAIALNTRGPALGEKLAELFPEAAAPSEKPPATEKPAAEKPPAAESEAKPEAASEAPPAAPAEQDKAADESAPAPAE